MTPGRPFAPRDAALLLASLVAGLTWAGSAWPTLSHIFTSSARYHATGSTWADPDGRAEAAGLIRIAARLLAATLGPPTLTVVLLASCRSHPGRRAAWRGPGVIACAAASAALILEVAAYPAWLLSMYGELTRAQGDARNNIVQLPRLRQGANLAGSIACGLGKHPGLAAVGVVFGRWMARLPTTGPSWLDRVGRWLAAGWIVAASGLALAPILEM